MDEKRTQAYKGSPLLKIALFGVALFLLGTLVVWQTKIADKREELSLLQAQITAQETRNQEIRKAVDALDSEEGLQEYAEKKARDDLGYAKPGERIFLFLWLENRGESGKRTSSPQGGEKQVVKCEKFWGRSIGPGCS